MGQDSDLVQLRKDLKQLQDDSITRDQQFQEMNKRQDRLEVKLDERFDQLLSYMKEFTRTPEQKEKSLSFDSMEGNFGSTSKGGFHAGDGGGFQRLKIASAEECQEIENIDNLEQEEEEENNPTLTCVEEDVTVSGSCSLSMVSENSSLCGEEILLLEDSCAICWNCNRSSNSCPNR
ncbi:hypothetical protein FH972_022287 [Carpinus fangiana]|uniref:Uncharacterized protein n=1 Tax=Carpinus fangiana TaxID=176857 RepID=A0A5N6KSG0_9ROSI|nr:hypothetical protein FH972_022287 [Carpinus fangiana]